MIFQNKIKQKLIEVLRELKAINLSKKDEQLDRIIEDTRELIEHHEYGVGLENLLDNLYEFDIKINAKILKDLKEITTAMQLDWEEWKFLESLNTESE